MSFLVKYWLRWTGWNATKFLEALQPLSSGKEVSSKAHSSNIIKPAVFVWLSIHNFVRNDGQHNTCLYSKLSFKWPLWKKNSSLNTTSFTTTPQCGDMKIRAGFCDACVYIELNSCHANLFNTHKHLSYQTINFLRTYIIIA